MLADRLLALRAWTSRPKKRRVRALLASLAAISLVGIAAITGAPATAANVAPEVQVILTTANSGELTPGSPLRSFVTINNPTPNDTGSATATISVDPSRFTSRDSLDDWFSGKTASKAANRAVAHTAVPSVGAQLSTLVSADAPAASLGFRLAGVYGVLVTVTSGSTVLGTARSAVAWGTASNASVPVAIAVPITVPAGETEFLTATELSKYTGPNGVLTRELSDVEDTAVAIGIDPRIIASIRVLGTSAPASADAWLDALAALPNESFPLAWADADLTAPLHAGSNAVLTTKSLSFAINPSLFRVTGDSTPTPTPTPGADNTTVPTSAGLTAWNYTLPKLQWPAADSVEPTDLAKLGEAGIETVILSSKNVDSPDNDGLKGASGKSASTSALVSDDVLSAYFTAAVQATTRIGTIAAVNQLVTSFAVIGQQSSGSPRAVLLTLGRNWAESDTSFSRAISEVFSRPGVSNSSLTNALQEPATKLTVDKDSQPEAYLDEVRRMLAVEARLDRFSVIAANPVAITSSYRLQLLSLLSNEWTDTPAARDKAITSWVDHTDGVIASVHVSRSGSALALADQVALPITVVNGLDQAVTVTMEVRSTTPQVSVDPQYQTQTVTIDADSQKRVQIPIEALTNGKGKVVVSLHSGTGLEIGAPVTLKVNVQAGWETLGTLIFVALIVALFAFGLIRRFRKSRRERIAGADSEPTDQASDE